MLLVIDNYDSFTYNLVQYFGELGAGMEVVRSVAHSVFGVQFHPESIGTAAGMRMLQNFIALAGVAP